MENKKLQAENEELKQKIKSFDAYVLRDEKLAVAIETLEYYGNRMDSGGTAREALEKIKGDRRNI